MNYEEEFGLWGDCENYNIGNVVPFHLGIVFYLLFAPTKSKGRLPPPRPNDTRCFCLKNVLNSTLTIRLSETCESGVRSHHGNGNFACCRFPFIYEGKSHDTCVLDDKTGQFWCATSNNYDQDKLFGYC